MRRNLAKYNAKQIGLAGETAFEIECNEANVTFNKPQQDGRAWDYLIEFDQLATTTIPLDRHPEHPKLQVQIKSSVGQRNIQIKLSNAEIMAKSQFPFFIIFYSLDENLQIRQKYGFHIWQDEIERTLEKLRKNTDEQGKARKPLNAITLSFTLNKGTEISGNVVDWMKSQIGDFVTYSNRKRDIINAVGDPGHSISFDAQPEVLVDLMLGGRFDVKLDRVQRFDTRFGEKFLVQTMKNVSMSIEV